MFFEVKLRSMYILLRVFVCWICFKNNKNLLNNKSKENFNDDFWLSSTRGFRTSKNYVDRGRCKQPVQLRKSSYQLSNWIF